jgi:acetoin utilization protein AcuB
MKHTPVNEVMTTDVISINADLSVDVALEIMNANDIRRLPVLTETGRLIGIITKYDAMLAMPKGADALTTGAADIPKIRETMTDYVYTVSPDDSVARAAQLMLNHGVGGLPVLESNRVVGIVTESDLFKFMVRELQLDAEGSSEG